MMRYWVGPIYLVACSMLIVSCDDNDATPPEPQPPGKTTKEPSTSPCDKGSAPDELTKELAILRRKLDRRCDELEKQLARSSGEQRAYTLNQIAELGTPRAMELVSAHYDTLEWQRQHVLVNAVVRNGGPPGAPLLLRIARTGNSGQRRHAIPLLRASLGQDAHAHLLSLQKSEKEPRNLAVIKEELLKLKDPATLKEIRQNFKSLGKGSPNDMKAVEDLRGLVAYTRCTEVANEVSDLFQRINWSQSDSHRLSKQNAAQTALWLGHRASMKHIIELLKEPELDLLQGILETATKQKFGTYEEWKQWWDREGKNTRSFTAPIPPDEQGAIMNAVLTWGRSQKSGPFIKRKIVYLEVPWKRLGGEKWEEIRKELRGDVRAYRSVEITLLGVRPYSVDSITSNGVKAYATLGDGYFRSKWRLVHLELEKDKQDWKVVRKLPGRGWGR